MQKDESISNPSKEILPQSQLLKEEILSKLLKLESNEKFTTAWRIVGKTKLRDSLKKYLNSRTTDDFSYGEFRDSLSEADRKELDKIFKEPTNELHEILAVWQERENEQSIEKLQKLPTEIWYTILEYLTPAELFKVGRTCSFFKGLALSDLALRAVGIKRQYFSKVVNISSLIDRSNNDPFDSANHYLINAKIIEILSDKHILVEENGKKNLIHLLEYHSKDMKPFKHTKTFDGHKDTVLAITKVSDTTFASASGDNSIKIWDIKSSKCIKTLECLKNEFPTSLAVSERENLLVSGHYNGRIRIWNLNTYKFTEYLAGPYIPLKGISVTKNKLMILISPNDNSLIKTVQFWDINQAKITPINTITLPKGCDQIKFLPNGNLAALIAGQIDIYEPEALELKKVKTITYGWIDERSEFAPLLDNKIAVTRYMQLPSKKGEDEYTSKIKYGWRLCILDLESEEVINDKLSIKNGVITARMLPDGNLLAITVDDKGDYKAKIWGFAHIASTQQQSLTEVIDPELEVTLRR